MVFVSFIDTGAVSDKAKAMIWQCYEIYWVKAEGKGSGYL
jgi:NADPH-dependent 7-cyano-7-deazaguanine reductase QueF-like protein